MKLTKIVPAAMLIPLIGMADQTTLKLGYEYFDFDHSLMKDRGKRYGIYIKQNHANNIYQLRFERTLTDTLQPPLLEDLRVNKYALKYTYRHNLLHAVNISFLNIEDNLMKETDNGRIYGIGYQYRTFGISQYFSDYKHFNVYQTDLKYTFKYNGDQIRIDTTVLGKYQHLWDKDSNTFSKNAQSNYFTPGIKIHLHYQDYHFGTGAFFGKRVFALMGEGMRIQHHAMEFDKTYMAGVGRHFGKFDIHLKYAYQEATELPRNNPDVNVNNFMVQFGYHF